MLTLTLILIAGPYTIIIDTNCSLRPTTITDVLVMTNRYMASHVELQASC